MSNFPPYLTRSLTDRLPPPDTPRIAVLTGARQTGKTTLARRVYPGLRYINLDAPENRDALRETSTIGWGQTIGNAIIDEAHKAPVVFEKVKYAFDEKDISFTVLTGSSQILLLKNICESLAGRAFFYELWPMMQCELCSHLSSGETGPPMLHHLAAAPDIGAFMSSMSNMVLEAEDFPSKAIEAHLLAWGGMPSLLELSDEDRWQWLKNYGHTYLERDLRDLSRMDDLAPFRKFQKLSALRSAMLLNYSELARDAAISVDTARRYLEYLRISYQIVLLQPYYRNLTSSAVKTPKLYWTDIGIWRQLTGFRGASSGQLYESMVVSEVIKWVRTAQDDLDVYYYRTRSGLEVDLLLENAQGVIGIEIKSRETISGPDTSALKAVALALGDRWRGGLVIYSGRRIERIADPNIWAIPSRRLFQPLQ
ncbi:MAG: ATP-binding protein [Pseudomonadota bacterium]